MKITLFLGLVLSLGCSQASADDYYASVRGILGKSQVKSGSKKSSFISEGVDLSFGTYLTPQIRSEISLGFLTGKKKIDSGNSKLVNNPKFKNDVYSLMLNGYYDFEHLNLANPYLMAGLGYAKNKSSLKYLANANGVTTPGKSSVSKNNFAWQIGAGVDMKAANEIKIGLGYRYRDTGSSSTNFKIANEPLTLKRKPYHLLTANVRMDF